ncbi:MAG: DUF885 domain-containing protein [Burkholderiales bacterium]|nr:DUF885 domain-containing protein [Burkholderiales bacterium]
MKRFVRPDEIGVPRIARWMFLASALFAAVALAQSGDATQQAHALFDEYWEQTARDYPGWATWRGDHRFDDRLTDESPAARAARDEQERRWLQRARAIDRAALSAADRVSLDLFVFQRNENVEMQPFEGARTMSLGSSWGFHTGFGNLLRVMPVQTPAQAERVLARFAALPRRVDEELASLRRGIALGWVGARPVIERVLAQLDGQIELPIDDGPFMEPMRRLGSDIPAAERETLRERARQAVAMQVLPAMRKLRSFVADEYLPAAPADGALRVYPGGEQVYAKLVAQHTTLPIGPRQLHGIGLREVERLRGEIGRTMRDAGFDGSFAQWVRQLDTDPKYAQTSAEALLAGYRDIAKRIDPELPRLFAVLPRATYGIRATPAHMGPKVADSYDGPALDGSRAGWFSANALDWRERPTWGMETLVAHEAVPGHHLQAARAAELGELPEFRRDAFFTAYVEGWALYAETLGFELGLYRDPASRFGHLQWQIFRAARLVVDTGIHALGWSRQRAIDYLVETSGLDSGFVAAEVDRYTSTPGQALAYMTGMLKIVELRDRARAALGERFDIRRFHNVLLDQGALPLPVLEAVVDEWIETQRAAAR